MTATARTGRSDRLDRFSSLLDRSAEPLGFAAGDTNVTRYVGNTSTTEMDPSGLKDDGHNRIVDPWWPGINDTIPKGNKVGDPIPTNKWFGTNNNDWAFKDKDSGYTLAVKEVEICDSRGTKLRVASAFIFDENNKLIGQLLLTKPLDKNGQVPKGGWTLLSIEGGTKDEPGLGFKIINPSGGEQGKIEVSGKFGGFLENVDVELGIEIALVDEEGKFKPSAEGGTICASFAFGKSSNEKDLTDWYRNTKGWYDENF